MRVTFLVPDRLSVSSACDVGSLNCVSCHKQSHQEELGVGHHYLKTRNQLTLYMCSAPSRFSSGPGFHCGKCFDTNENKLAHHLRLVP